MKHSRTQRNVFTFINGKVYGNFHPEFRAGKEAEAARCGMSFDALLMREHSETVRSLMSLL